MKRRASNNLIGWICFMNGLDVTLFEHEEEWNLADAYLFLGISDEDVAKLEAIAERIK